jgi:tRNA 2-thiouridine synthesizing protein A
MMQKPDHTLDARGLNCPEPIMLLHNRVRDMLAGELLELLATDPSTERDVQRFCQFLDFELIDEPNNDIQGSAEFRFLIRKRGE